MTHANQPGPSGDAAKGMALMAGAMLIVPGLDAIAKLLGETLPPFQIGFMRYAVQVAILVLVHLAIARAMWTDAVRAALPRLALAGLWMGLGVGFLFWAVRTLPIANAIAIFFVEPLILTIFAAVFLRERVGWHRRAAVAVGLVGALIVIRPNYAAFGPAAILPLFAAVTYAAFIVTIRSVSRTLDGMRIQLAAGTFASLFLGTILLVGSLVGAPLLAVATPAPAELPLILALGLIATAAQLIVTQAVKLTEASILAPFQYLEIISATALGYLIFGDFPDALTWAGTAIILSAGLYVFHRERRLARRSALGREMPAPLPPGETRAPP